MKEKTAINENTQLAKNVKAKGKEVSVNEEALMKKLTKEERRVLRRVKWKQIKNLPEEQMRELDKRVERREERLEGQLVRAKAVIYGMGAILPIIYWCLGMNDLAVMVYTTLAIYTCAFLTACTGIRISLILRPVFCAIQFIVIKSLGAILCGGIACLVNGSTDSFIEGAMRVLTDGYGQSDITLIIIPGILLSLIVGLVNNPHKVMARQEYARMVCQRGGNTKKAIDPNTLPKAKKKGFFAKRREAKENAITLDRYQKKVIKIAKRSINFTFYAFCIALVVEFAMSEYIRNTEYMTYGSSQVLALMSVGLMLVLGYFAAYNVSFGYALFSAIRNGVLLILTLIVILSVDPDMGGLEGVINSLEYMWDRLLLISLAWLAPTLIGGILGSIFKKVNKGVRARKRERRRAKRAAANAKAKAKEKQNKEGSKEKAQAQKK